MKKILSTFITAFIFSTAALAQIQIGLGKMHAAYGITVANGKIYATNPGLHYVAITNLSNGRISSFGSFGNSNGAFNTSGGISADPNGKIYVADLGNNRIQVFDANGNYITKFGNGYLSLPNCVFYGSDSRIYVGEKNTDRVSVFDASYNLLYSFGTTGSGDGQFNDVSMIYVDQNQVIYTIDFVNNTIQLFNGANNGSFIRRFGSGHITQGGSGISVDEQTGIIYASEYNNIHKFDINGNHLGSFSGSNNRQLYFDPTTRHLWIANDNGYLMEYDLTGTMLAQYGSPTTTDEADNLSSPMGVAVDASGNLVVAANTGGNYSIKRFNAQGEFLNKFSTFVKIGVDIDGSNNIIAVGNGELKKFSTTGTVLATKSLGFNTERVAISSDGKFYLPQRDLSGSNDRIQVFNSDLTFNRYIGSSGTGNGQFTSPDDLALDDSNNLYVIDGTNKTLQKFISNDVFQWKITFSGNVSSLAISPDNKIYVAENDKIKKFDSDGNLLATFGSSGLNLGQFYRPRFMTFAGNNLVISEQSSNRVMIVPPTAEIGVALSGGGNIVSGGTVDIGNAPIGSSLTAGFSIVSQGIEPLQLTGSPKVVLSGPNAADFSVDQSLLTNTVNGTNTFKVTYTGSTNGVRTATLTIANNDADESSFSFTITASSKLSQSISGFNTLADRVYGDNSFEVSATASSGLPVQFSSSNTNVATVSGNTVTIVGAGLANITASQPGNSTYTAATEVVRPLVVIKAALTATAVNLSRAFGEANPTTQITYEGFVNGDDADDLDVKPTATIAMTAVSGANAGTQHAISIGGGSDQSYTISYTNGQLTINKASATVNLTAGTFVYDGGARGASVTTVPYGLPVSITFEGNTEAPANAGSYEVLATVNHINYTGTATATLTITKATAIIQLNNNSFVYDGSAKSLTTTTVPAGVQTKVEYKRNGVVVANPKSVGVYDAVATLIDPNFEDATQSATLTITKATASITLDALTHTYDGSNKSATVSTTPSGVSYSIEFKQGGSVVSQPKNAGSYEVTVSLTDPNFETSTQSGTLTINKASASVSIDNLAYTFDGDTKLASVTTVPAGLAYSIEYKQNGVVVSQPKEAGSYDVTVTLTDANTEATTSTATLVIGKANQTVTFAALASKTFGDADFELTATSSSLLPVSFESADESILKITGTSAHIVKAGTVVVKAKQVGNSNFAAGEQTQTLVIAKASQTITFPALDDKMDTALPFAVNATASSGLPVNFEVVSGPATVSGNTITLTKEEGTVVVKATQGGNDNYLAAASQQQTFKVTMDIVAGVGERFVGDVFLGPVPATDVLTIRLHDDKLAAVTLYDLSGRVVETEVLETAVAEHAVSVTGMTPGVYVVQMATTKGFKLAKRIMIR